MREILSMTFVLLIIIINDTFVSCGNLAQKIVSYFKFIEYVCIYLTYRKVQPKTATGEKFL